MQVIHWCSTLHHSWSLIQRMDNRDMFMEVSTLLKDTAGQFITKHRWEHNLRIGSSPS
jgi:hypothetical protein